MKETTTSMKELYAEQSRLNHLMRVNEINRLYDNLIDAQIAYNNAVRNYHNSFRGDDI